MSDLEKVLTKLESVIGTPMRQSGMSPSEYHMADMQENALNVIADARAELEAHEENILEEANRIVGIGRGRSLRYGHPAINFAHTANLWAAAFGWEVDAAKVAMAQILLKVSRECNSHTRDNLTDIAGYARTLEMVHEYVEEQLAIAEVQKSIREHVEPPGSPTDPASTSSESDL